MKGALVHIITKLELGGAQKIALSILKGMAGGNFDLYLITGTGGVLEAEAKEIPGLKIHFVGSLVRPIQPLKDLQAFFCIFTLLRKIKRSLGSSETLIVHTHSSKAGIVGRWAAFFSGVPFIFHTYHGFGFHDYQGFLLRKLFIWVEKITSWITDKVVGVSAANIQKGEGLGIWGCEKTQLIHYGIELSKFNGKNLNALQKKKALGLPLDGPLIGMIACFKPQKAPLDFIRMAQHVLQEKPQSLFVIVGDGALRPDIEAMIRQLGLKERVFLLGWRHDIPEILNVLDVFVLTSLWEGLPVSLLEAMASGLPIVATRVDGSPEVIRDGITGFLVPPKDTQEMSRCILNLLKDPVNAKIMGKKGQEVVQPFGMGKMVQSYRDLYEGMFQKPLNG